MGGAPDQPGEGGGGKGAGGLGRGGGSEGGGGLQGSKDCLLQHTEQRDRHSGNWQSHAGWRHIYQQSPQSSTLGRVAQEQGWAAAARTAQEQGWAEGARAAAARAAAGCSGT